MNSIRFVFFILLSFSAQVQAAQNWGSWSLNDVSYLMPLPEKIESTELIHLQRPALGGAVLPTTVLDKVPLLSMGHTREQSYQTLRVIGVRIDPCFPLPTPQSCQRQVRLVWQPLEMTSRRGLQTVDAALHAFYILDDQQFTTLLKDLENWKVQYAASTTGVALQIHPAWAEEGARSPALAAFNKLILKYIGVQNLSRVTAMVVRGAGDMWAFAGFDFVGGQLQSFRIPRINRNSQAFINFAVPADHFANGQITPAPAGADTFNKLMEDSGQMLEKESPLLSEFNAITRIEDPRVFTPENMDCVSCHVAHQARQWSVFNRRDLSLQDLWDKTKYQNAGHNLENKSTEILNTQSIRAFGYFGKEVVISQRVVNESAEVADAVNAWLKKAK